MSGRNMFLIIIWITVAVSTHRVTHSSRKNKSNVKSTGPVFNELETGKFSTLLANSHISAGSDKTYLLLLQNSRDVFLPVFSDIKAADTVAADDGAACTVASRQHARPGSKAWTTGHCGSCSVTYPAVWRHCSQAVSGNCHYAIPMQI